MLLLSLVLVQQFAAVAAVAAAAAVAAVVAAAAYGTSVPQPPTFEVFGGTGAQTTQLRVVSSR